MNTLVLTAAGNSTRMGGSVKKEYLTLREGDSGRISVLSQSLYAFLDTRLFTIIAITIPTGGEAEARKVLAEDARIAPLLGLTGTALLFANGGSTRQASVRSGLEAILRHRTKHHDDMPNETPPTQPSTVAEKDIVLVHDAARPYVTDVVIRTVLDTVALRGAAVPAIPPVDTEKEIDGEGKIVRHLDRSSIVAVQTPQGFFIDPLVDAHRKATDDGRDYTDDAEIWGRYAGDVWTCPGDRANGKITYAGDIT